MAAKRILEIFVCLCILFYTSESQTGQYQAGQSNETARMGAEIVEKLLVETSNKQLGDSLKKLTNCTLGVIVQSVPKNELKKLLQGLKNETLGRFVKAILRDGQVEIFNGFQNFAKDLSDAALGDIVAGLPKDILQLAIQTLTPEELGKFLKNETSSAELGKVVKASKGETILALLQCAANQGGATIIQTILSQIPNKDLGNLLKSLTNGELGSFVQRIPAEEFIKIIISLRNETLVAFFRGIRTEGQVQIFKDLDIPVSFLKPTLELSNATLGNIIKALNGIDLVLALKKIPGDSLKQIPNSTLGEVLKALSGCTIINVLQGRIPKDPKPSGGGNAICIVLKEVGLVNGLNIFFEGVENDVRNGKPLENNSVASSILDGNSLNGVIGALGGGKCGDNLLANVPGLDGGKGLLGILRK